MPTNPEPASQWSPKNLDKLVNDPTRMAILHMLSDGSTASFTFLQQTFGLTKGNLSTHLTKLHDAGYVAIERVKSGAKEQSMYHATDAGIAAMARHWAQLDRLRAMNPGTT